MTNNDMITTNADNLQQEISQLSSIGQRYVLHRSQHLDLSLSACLKQINVPRQRFYDAFNADERDYLEDVALRIHQNTQFQTMKSIAEASHKAAQKLIELMDGAKSEYVQYQSATKLLEYALGTPQQRVDMTTQGEKLSIRIEYENGNDYS
jgi:hypothetical protein